MPGLAVDAPRTMLNESNPLVTPENTAHRASAVLADPFRGQCQAVALPCHGVESAPIVVVGNRGPWAHGAADSNSPIWPVDAP